MNDWLIPLTVLAAGAIAGAVLALRTKTLRAESVPQTAALAAERDAILSELRTLTDESQRYELELRAAKIWRDLDRLQKKSAKIPDRRPTGMLRGFAWGMGVVVAVALIVALVQHNSTPKAAAQTAQESSAVTRHPDPAITGVLELDPKVKFTPGAVVYVVARATEGGPPIAVAKLHADSFPLPFTLGAHASMSGGALPEKVRVEARIDSDGDAITRSPTDPSGSVDQITPGQGGVRITLQ